MALIFQIHKMEIKKYDKGVAGLNLFLSLVVSLFIIGLIIMIFALIGGGLVDASYTATGAVATGETLTNVNNVTSTSFANAGLTGVACSSVSLYNATYPILATNYTVTGCSVILTATTSINGTNILTNYTYAYSANNDATRSIGNTTAAIATAVDWFDIFIVIGAMVVLILLTVIIIASIRGSGLITETA